jgi:alkyl hydroperoxide reductase subunit AhpC
MSKAFVTKPAPAFSCSAVVNGSDFTEVKLSDYKGKYLVIVFYPLDFTFVCPTEILAFNDRVKEFQAIGCEVIVCSTDSQFSHHAWAQTERKAGGLKPITIPMLADPTHQMSKDYGVYVEEDGFNLRGLFIIDDKGILRQTTINDRPVGRCVDETLRLVQAFKFTDEHGEVCPIGWTPGSATIKPDVEDKKEYFEKAN